jgi:hypothetical protein
MLFAEGWNHGGDGNHAPEAVIEDFYLAALTAYKRNALRPG